MKITGNDATALNYSARYDCAPPLAWKRLLTPKIAAMLYNDKSRNCSRTLKKMRMIAKANSR